jgi:cbb3-type cytochrome oxidase subunit 1
MPKIALMFMTAAAACLVAGVTMGIVMGIAHDFSLAPVHAHLNLLGWVSLAVMGLTYRAWPSLAERRHLALMQVALSAPSAVLMPAGIWLAFSGGGIGLAVVASLAWLAGALLFLVRLAALLLEKADRFGTSAVGPAVIRR